MGTAPATHPVRHFLAEARCALATGRFWGSLARNGIPVAGVFAFRWPAMVVVLYFLVEIWLFLSLRISFEITVDPKYRGRVATDPREILSEASKIFLAAGPLTAALLGLVMWPVLAVVFARDRSWEELAGIVLESQAIRVGLLVMIGFLLWDALQFARRFPDRSQDQEAMDEYRAASMVMRAVALAGVGSVAIFIPFGSGGRFLVVAIALISVWIEGMPRHAAKAFGYLPKLPRDMER